MATFTVPPTTATFRGTIRGSQQDIGDLQRLTLGVLIEDEAEWLNLQSLVTSKYHVHVPLSGGDPIIDIVRGPGDGALMVDGFGETSALLVGLTRPTYLPYARSMGTANFLVTGNPL